MRALVVVDMQYDFMDNGKLPIPHSWQIVPKINNLMKTEEYEWIFYTKDWHPVNHCSFLEQGGLWPKHCVKWTHGAEIVDAIQLPLEMCSKAMMILKGHAKDVEEYSGASYIPNLPAGYEFDVVGLATDYCVKETALAIKAKGYRVNVILDCCRGVEDSSTTTAIEEMTKEGINIQ